MSNPEDSCPKSNLRADCPRRCQEPGQGVTAEAAKGLQSTHKAQKVTFPTREEPSPVTIISHRQLSQPSLAEE